MGMPRWFQVGWLTAAVAIGAGAIGPDWLAALLIIPGGIVVFVGALRTALNRRAALDFSRMHTRGNAFLGRAVTLGAAVIGLAWIVAGAVGTAKQLL